MANKAVDDNISQHLTAIGRQDLEWFIAQHLGVRTWRCMGGLDDDEVREACQLARCLGFSLGHVSDLRHLCAEARLERLSHGIVPMTAGLQVWPSRPFGSPGMPFSTCPWPVPEAWGFQAAHSRQWLPALAPPALPQSTLPQPALPQPVLPTASRSVEDLLQAALKEISEATCAGNEERSALAEVARLLVAIQSAPDQAPIQWAAQALDLVRVACFHRSELMRSIQDIIVLGCARVAHTNDRDVLKAEFPKAFSRDLNSDEDKELLSRLMNSRFQLYERKHHKKGKKKQSGQGRENTAAHSEEMQTENDIEVQAEAEVHEVFAPKAESWVERSVRPDTPNFGLPKTLVKNTFLELETEDDLFSESGVSLSRTSIHDKWPKAARPTSVAFRCHTVDEVIEQMRADGEDFKIDDVCKDALNALLGQLPQLRADKLVQEWVRAYRNPDAPRREFGVNTTKDVVQAARCMMQRFQDDEPLLGHYCGILGTFAVAEEAVADPVIQQLSSTMQANVARPRLLTTCGLSLLRILQAHRIVLGCSASGRATIRETVAGIAKAMPAATQESEMWTKLRARSQPFECILKEVGRDATQLSIALSEIFQGLQKLLSWSYSDSGDEDWNTEGDEVDKKRDRALLLDLAHQAHGSQNLLNSEELDQDVVLQIVESWVRESGEAHSAKLTNMQQRFLLVGLLLGVHQTVMPMLLRAFRTGISHAVHPGAMDSAFGMESHTLDEQLICAALRAVIEFQALGLVDQGDAQTIIQHATDKRFAPQTRFCHSAYVGTLGSLCNPSVEPVLWDNIFEGIITTGKTWLPLPYTDGIVYEALWALGRVLKMAGSLRIGKWAEKCFEFVNQVRDNEWLQSSLEDQWKERCPDAVRAMQEADKLACLLQHYCKRQ